MDEQRLHVGKDFFAANDSPHGLWSAFFEDDGETGYFYALDLSLSDHMILDAVSVYAVEKVVDRDRPCTLAIVWSEDGSKCALLINSYPHAAFDFAARRGYCRSNFPNFSSHSSSGWRKDDHSWSDDAVAWLYGPGDASRRHEPKS